MKKLSFFTALLMLAASVPAFSQIKTPAPSPGSKVSQDVGLIQVEVEYSRPGAKGRKIFGDLVPFGALWRTGANASTKVNFSDDATVGGVKLPKGKYALYTVPGEKEWSIVFYKNTSYWGAPEPKDFKEEEVAARFNAPVVMLKDRVETFTIGFNNLKNDGADMEISWENTKVVVPIGVDTDAKVTAAIKSTMEGPSAGDYWAAGRYYYEEKKDMKQALEWVNKAMEKGGEKFWMLRMKSLIQAEMGQHKEAIATAEKSMEMAKTEGNNDYVRMNEKSIAEWKEKTGMKK
ncbi:MAG: DUF2911 domain-containing protein [Saprospiraceae bacterium]|nr:DUF2911 domain-containing protein [Lewinellaceae bacterium]